MKPLQPTGHRESHYERPDGFVCGRLDAPCPAGPDARGRCGGEPSCRPRRSARGHLTRVTAWTAAATAIATVLVLVGPWQLAAVSPGPLAAPHQAIEGAAPGDPNCGACHVAADGGPGSWLWSAVAGAPHLADDERCLECHFAGASRSSAARVHSAVPEQLARITAALIDSGRGDGSASPPPTDPGGRLACATCHREHGGGERSLTALPDASCQVCHARRFGGLGDGHPEFAAVDRPRAGISFDHVSHRSRFGDESFDCSRCHAPEREGRAMDLVPFERACRGCHHQGREDHHGESIAAVSLTLVQLPEMELPDDVVWPVDVAWGDDVMPPLMRLLLLGDEMALEPLEQIADEADGIPYDWLPDEDAPLAAFAGALRRVIADLAAEDPAPLRERLVRALGRDTGDPVVERLAEQLAGARFAAAVWRARWLPGLAADGSGAAAPSSAPPDWSTADTAAGWLVDPDSGEIRYVAVGHADPLFQALVESLFDADSRADAHDDLRADERRQLARELFAERGGPLRGACLRCHLVEARARVPTDPWHALGRGDGSTGFRHFDHQPHVAMLRDPGDCSRCHVLVTDAPEPFESRGFAPHRRELCATCHSEDGAGEACLLCHDYHFARP